MYISLKTSRPGQEISAGNRTASNPFTSVFPASQSALCILVIFHKVFPAIEMPDVFKN
jgi:hypothetical protein